MFRTLCNVVKNYKPVFFFVLLIFIASSLAVASKELVDETEGLMLVVEVFVSFYVSAYVCCLLEHCADAMRYMERKPLATKKEAWEATKFNDDNVELFL